MAAGAVLLILGIAASIVAVPANVLAFAWLKGENVNIELTADRTLTAGEHPPRMGCLWIIVAADLVRVRIWEHARSEQAWIAVLNPYLHIITRS